MLVLRRAFRFVVCLVLVCCWPAVWAQTRVDAFSPQGEVREVRQVVARFSQPMVTFGDLRAAAPFDVDCAVPGSARWIDARTWSYDFEHDLPGATACRFNLKPGVRDLAGQPLDGARAFAFTTGGPALLETQPQEGAERIDEQQAFVLALSAPALETSIAAHAWCRADGIGEKIGVRVVTGEARIAALLQDRWQVAQYADKEKDKDARASDFDNEARLRAADGAGRLRRLVVLQCRRTLPASTEVALVWGAGVAAPNGVATTQDQTLKFKTRPDFNAQFACERPHARAACIPLLPMRVRFSAPVAVADADKVYLEGAGGKRYPVRIDKHERDGAVESVVLPGPFPENARLTLHLPQGLHDDAGRPLVNAARFPLAVRTGEQPPLVKFAAPFGIVEANGERLLPVTVRNVEAELAGRMHVDGASVRLGPAQVGDVLAWMRRVSGPYGGSLPRQPQGKELETSIFARTKPEALQRFTLPKPNGRRAFEVIGIPLRQPGFYAIELQSARLGAAINPKGRMAYVRSTALVTNLAAHFEHGAQSSLVWVTSLDKGSPVAGARVEVRDAEAHLLWSGASDARGIARIDKPLQGARTRGRDTLFVSAALGEDFTFTLSDWREGIESWRFNLPVGSLDEDSRQVATVFDRTLLRAGETVHMKHFLRRRTGQGFAFVRASDAPARAVRSWGEPAGADDKRPLPAKGFLIHQGSGEKTEFALDWRANGSAEGAWTIPPDAKLGVYAVMIGGQEAGQFRVEQFRVPTMKALLAGPTRPVVAPQSVSFDAQVGYLAGGPAGGAPVKLHSVVQDGGVHFDGYEDFALGSGDVREGAVRQEEGSDDDEGEGEDADGARQGQDVARTQSLQLDRAGGARIKVDGLPHIERPKTLLAELSYQDANGETLSTSASVALWPSSWVVGIKLDGWLLRRDALKFQTVVLDVDGKPVTGAPVTVDFLKRLTYSHRRRLVGGFYAYENNAEIKRIGEACSGVTDAHGLLTCQVRAPEDGDLILRAHASDAQGRLAASYHEVWIAGEHQQWFAATDNDRIDLLPAQKRYEPGETARFQVRSPFRRATVLVTVEREGILDTYVRQLSGREQEISIPVKASYAPNVFVSALVVRGRVAGVQPTALVDLGKPAYKLGIAPIQVGWGGHELKVEVAADKPVYKVREQAHVRVRVQAPAGMKLAPGAEVAVAAVDAGLLELMPNDSWKLLDTMMRARSLQVETSTAQMQVVGKRHFGRKAVPHGGGGGRSGARELFETLLLWRGRVTLDADGQASLDVPLNDSLTTFRIVAVASSGAGLFGSGSVDVRSSQDLMLVSGLPPVVREGDRLRAGFTLRNASDHALSVRLEAGMAADAGSGQALAAQQVDLAPGQSREVGWDVQVPPGAQALHWDVRAAGAGASDRIKVSQQVALAVPLRTLQATLVQLNGEQNMPVERPQDALPGRGGIRTTLQAHLADALPGVHDYMAAYPYTCFEQRTSRAVALRDPKMWEQVVATLPAHLDGDGLVKYFAPMQEGSDVLTAYVLSLTDAAGYPIPDDLKSRMQGALAGFVEGKVVRGNLRASGELAVRKLAALEALSRSGLVRPAMLDSIALEPNLWPTSALLDWYQVLRRTPELPQRDARLVEASRILRARLTLQGTTMGFSTERSDDWWWLMTSGDVNANRLLLATLDDPAWREDAGRLARATLGRQHHGHWDTTTANAWGVVALDHFSQAYEREPVSGNAGVTLTPASGKPLVWTGPIPADKPVTVLQAWPEGRATLSLRQLGSGKPWATVQSLAAVPLKTPLSAGYRIVRSVTPVEQKTAGAWTRGDVYRVHLDIDAQADMNWVVVDDPIPAGASILGTGLGRDAALATRGERQGGWVWPAFQERTHTAFRSYYEWVPKGRFSVEYTVRLNNAGRFALPTTRVEAMYDPEAFGELPNAGVSVAQ